MFCNICNFVKKKNYKKNLNIKIIKRIKIPNKKTLLSYDVQIPKKYMIDIQNCKNIMPDFMSE